MTRFNAIFAAFWSTYHKLTRRMRHKINFNRTWSL